MNETERQFALRVHIPGGPDPPPEAREVEKMGLEGPPELAGKEKGLHPQIATVDWICACFPSGKERDSLLPLSVQSLRCIDWCVEKLSRRFCGDGVSVSEGGFGTHGHTVAKRGGQGSKNHGNRPFGLRVHIPGGPKTPQEGGSKRPSLATSEQFFLKTACVTSVMR